MFFHYRQNNSGGRFVTDENVDVHVIIEANDADEANDRAERIGLYFDGCNEDEYGWTRDCPCCGSRWSRAWSDGDDTPSIYWTPLTGELTTERTDATDVVIHYKDGTILYGSSD